MFLASLRRMPSVLIHSSLVTHLFRFPVPRLSFEPITQFLPPMYAHLNSYSLNLPAFNAVPSPIVSASFNHTGTIFAYAAAYDWSKGNEGSVPSHWNKVLLHGCKEDEVKKRPPKPGMGHK